VSRADPMPADPAATPRLGRATFNGEARGAGRGELSVLLSVWGYSAFAIRYDQSFVSIPLTETPTYGS